jgi:hypothetical protein
VLALVALLCWACLAAPGASALEFESLGATYTDRDGMPARQAGSHPDIEVDFRFVPVDPSNPKSGPAELAHRLLIDLPRGLIGSPVGIDTCPLDGLKAGPSGSQAICPVGAQVGVIVIPGLASAPIYNVEVPLGEAGMFAFNMLGSVIRLSPTVRPGDYGVTVDSGVISQGLIIVRANITLWGVPADSSHDSQRWGLNTAGTGMVPGAPSPAPRRPFISLPTSCPATAAVTTAWLEGWDSIGLFSSRSFSSDLDGEPFVFGGCDRLSFSPTVQARPTTNVADSPSGLDVSIAVPQSDDPDRFATAHLKDATLVFPPGMTVNPAAADGLGACTTAQIGLTSPVGQAPGVFDGAPARCPDSSKLGTVQIETPLLDHPLGGAIYLASQDQNPFSSLLAVYIAIDDPQSGVGIKLAGRAMPDPVSGQLTLSFDDDPQLPFAAMEISLFTGPRAALKTPLACGSFATKTTMTPWSTPYGASVEGLDPFAVIRGANGSACVNADDQAPNRPAFKAGTVDPAAAAYSPFVLEVSREDGSQPIKAFGVTLPRGLLAKLAGIPYCSDAVLASAAGRSGKAEQASPSCPSASRVGSVTVDAGAGSTPLQVGGKAYLSGPYKGAPLSLAIVAPAVAGPFDLGNIVVRAALRIDPETIQIHVVSDPIPTILRGIPLNVRSIVVSMDRLDFTHNPSSCDPTAVLGSVTSVFNQVAAVSERFQVGGCRGLGFKPRLSLAFSGAPNRRGGYPAMKAVLTAPGGQANIGKATVILPRTQFLEQAHIRSVCTQAQFAADQCPAGAVYGYAKAWTPLLDKPLEGPVYLRTNGGERELPDIVADLGGQIDVELVGYVDSVRGKGSGGARIRARFASVPDAPVSRFVLNMKGGRKGLVVNSTNLCKAKPRAKVKFAGQNGKLHNVNPLVRLSCGKKYSPAKRPTP